MEHHWLLDGVHDRYARLSAKPLSTFLNSSDLELDAVRFGL
jgi:hypothetical protein